MTHPFKCAMMYLAVSAGRLTDRKSLHCEERVMWTGMAETKKSRRKKSGAKKNRLPMIVALVLIVVIALIGFGSRLVEKYSYSKETVDMDQYYGVGEGEFVILLQNDRLQDRAFMKSGELYFGLDTVKKYFNEGFYADRNEGKLLYTTARDTAVTLFGTKEYTDKNGSHPTEYETCYVQGENIFLSASYVKRFTNYEWNVFDRHIQVYTMWGTKQTMEVVKDTQLRLEGGIKSPILREIAAGELVELLEEGEDWSVVKTSDSIIGYVENKRMDNLSAVTQEPVTDYVEEEYTSVGLSEKVILGFHSIGGQGGNVTLDAMLAEGNCINVIAPTWFSLTDNEGNFRSYASDWYVESAHSRGLQVWGVWDNFNHRNETGAEVDAYQVLTFTAKRQKLVRDMVDTTLELGLDGINIDFEGLGAECGEHYIQFLKELSVVCRENGLILSVDNYVPLNFNQYYRLDIQGKVLDYVIIMGYDEHWRGSGDPGSVASIGYVSGGLDRTLEQVPAEKVVNALPFYTILWQTEGTKVTDQYVTMNNLKQFLEDMKVQLVWDETTCQNYGEWQSGSALYQIWAEDEESIAVKLNVMNARKIGGVAVWRLGYGTPEAWELIRGYGSL